MPWDFICAVCISALANKHAMNLRGNKSKSDPNVNKTAAYKSTSQTQASNDCGKGDQNVFVHLLHTFIMKSDFYTLTHQTITHKTL